MVFSKLNILRILFIAILSLVFATLLVKNTNPIETSLIKSILPQNITENTKIIPILEHSSSIIKIVFEANDNDSLQNLKDDFLRNIDSQAFTVSSNNFTTLFEWYEKTPSNFLSAKTRKLLSEKNYNSVYEEGLERLYDPAGFTAVELSRDPFLLLTDFLRQNNVINKTNYFDGKYYDTETIKINSNTNWTNKNIAELIKSKNKYSKNGNKIFLAGTPIHTYYTTAASIVSINLICFLITLLIIFLTYFYFKRFRLLIPIALSIAFGFLAGFAVTKNIYHNFHLITFLFGTTLIGIGIDYSYHYIFKENSNNKFYKNLTLSLLSTAISFSPLYLLKIDILNQTATFTITGLTAIYLFIIVLYPALNFPKASRNCNPKFNNKLKITFAILISAVIFAGIFRISFNDNLTSLYTPNKNLRYSEQLFNKISNPDIKNSTIIAVNGNSTREILEEEEKFTSQLDKNSINYISISKFIPSEKRQKENYDLTKKLYEKELDKYENILSAKQRNDLKKEAFVFNDFDIKDLPDFSDLQLDNNTSLIISFSNNLPKIESNNAEIIDIQTIVSKYLKTYRTDLLKIFPVIYLVLYLVLLFSYGFKQSTQMIIPIIISALFVMSFESLIGIKLNLFTLLGLILVLGFTTDYVIFSRNKSQQSLSAVFLACITTTLSFALLIFTTFKLISMLALTTSFGILSSYILIKILIRDDENVI